MQRCLYATAQFTGIVTGCASIFSVAGCIIERRGPHFSNLASVIKPLMLPFYRTQSAPTSVTNNYKYSAEPMNNKSNRLVQCALVILLSITAMQPARRVSAMPTDIVSTGSATLDAYAVLAKNNTLVGAQYTTIDFLGDRLWTRAELAAIIEKTVLADPASFKTAAQNSATCGALHAIVVELAPELTLDGYDAGALASQTAGTDASYDLLGKIEGRDNTEADENKNHELQSGENGIYRGAVQGGLGSSARYTLEVSNWPEDDRRVFDNDLGPHDFSALQEAYVEFDGVHGLRVDVGRMYDRWGPAERGATLLSDNSPPFDQINVSFPFSLGRHLGRNYSYDQMATIYSEFGSERYQEDRRIGYQFSKKWQFDVQEAFKSDVASSLAYTPIPFDIGRGFQITQAQNDSKYKVNATLSYSPEVSVRFYGQFLIDDIKGPFTGGRLLGFELGNTENIDRKVAYIFGFHAESKQQTGVTLEYDYADPITYTYRNLDAIWQHGTDDWIGLPDGPDSREVYARIDQRIGKPITLALDYRDRWRDNYSWISPTSKTLTAECNYQFSNSDSVGLSFTNYVQDPYPFVPGAAGSPTLDPNAPVSEGFFGQRLRANEYDLSYTHVF
jgi:hypothetical protein